SRMIRKLLLLVILIGIGYWAWTRHFGFHRVTQTIDDSSLTTEILARIAQVEPLSLLSIRVSTTKGVADISGHVRNQEEKSRVLAAARHVEGVRTLRDRIGLDSTLRTPYELKNDFEMTASIKKNLLQEEG